MIAIALLAMGAAMLLVRLGWAGRRGIAAGGWALAGAAMVALVVDGGAWGLAIGAVAGMAVAIGLVLHAGWITPAKVRRAPRETLAIDGSRHSGDIARRLLVFVLVVPVAFVAAQWLAFGAGALVKGRGMADADWTAVALFGQPLIWAVLMSWQMIQLSPVRMIGGPAAAAIAGTVLWVLA